ncbi:MAG: hypothetical protein HZY73_03930 [Micropruina sp.]|nr:MAG: hypothetical protein HZY73_03930 [Micropruina sp.]
MVVPICSDSIKVLNKDFWVNVDSSQSDAYGYTKKRLRSYQDTLAFPTTVLTRTNGTAWIMEDPVFVETTTYRLR